MNGLMRILAIGCLVLVAGCSRHPTDEENALVAFVEKHVALPKGSPGPRCYERYYRIVDGKELDAILPNFGKSGKRLLIGDYFPARNALSKGNPGISWVDKKEDVPEIFDGGCDHIGVYYLIGEPPDKISATCSFTIAGEIDDEVAPFSC